MLSRLTIRGLSGQIHLFWARVVSFTSGADDHLNVASPRYRLHRFLPGASQGDVYRIDGGGTAAHLIRSGMLDFAALSPDATQFTDFAAGPDGRS